MKARLLAVALLLALVTSSPVARADDSWWGTDKALHFDISLAAASGAYGLSALALAHPWQRAAVGAGFALTLGAGKELWDLSGHGDPSWKDFTWDVIGTAVGIGLALALDAITRGASTTETPRATAGGLAVRFR